MFDYIFFIVIGFASGSVLYSYLLPKWCRGVDIVLSSDDANPGMSNAVKCAGWGIGLLCLALDLGKGFLPVFWALCRLDPLQPAFALVIAAPVLGHAFSPLMRGRGGKAIAVSFGVLIGLLPVSPLVFVLAMLFLFFSGVVVIYPHRMRVIVVFGLLAVYSISRPIPIVFTYAILLISATVVYRHLVNGRHWEKFRIGFLGSRLEKKHRPKEI